MTKVSLKVSVYSKGIVTPYCAPNRLRSATPFEVAGLTWPVAPAANDNKRLRMVGK